jgi:serralysin
MTQPSANEQFMLELINAERAKAGVQPLAFDSNLFTASETHSQWMIATDTFSHTGAGGSTPTQRMASAGYQFAGTWASGENIAWASTRAPSGLQDEVQLLHNNLMNSPGHRANMLNGNFREVGIGFETGPYQNFDGAFVTENFARSGSGVQLTGVAFDDKDGDKFYDPGEGLRGIAVKAVGVSGATYSGTTMDAGGYQLDLPAGTYTVTFSGGGVATTTRQVTVGSTNVKVDLVDPAMTGTPAPTPPTTTPSTPVPSQPIPTPSPGQISGTSAANTLYGTANADTIKGLDGNDTLYGLGGNDRIEGGNGRDVLIGQGGSDHLLGGADADLFVFQGAWGADVIADFQNGLDHIDLRGNSLSLIRVGATDVDKDGTVDDVLIQANAQTIGILNTGIGAMDRGDFWF